MMLNSITLTLTPLTTNTISFIRLDLIWLKHIGVERHFPEKFIYIVMISFHVEETGVLEENQTPASSHTHSVNTSSQLLYIYIIY